MSGGGAALERRARRAFAGWQRQLAPAVRAELRALQAHRPPGLELVGVVLDRESEREHWMWTRDLYEYVNAHEEAGFFLQERHYHICRAHRIARAVIASGLIARDFRCAVSDRACPFAGASEQAGGRAIALAVRSCLRARRGGLTLGG